MKRDKGGFTLVELIAVLLILAILAAAVTGGLARARVRAWRQQACETCRQVCEAWNQYLLDERSFPKDVPNKGSKLETTVANLKWIIGKAEETKVVYLELSEDEDSTGLKDKWDQFYRFSLDTDYDGVVENPYPEALARDDSETDSFKSIKASSLAWSEGDPKRKSRPDNPIVAW